MLVIRVVVSAIASAVMAAPVSADVTVRSRTVQEDDGRRITEVTEYRKGLKIRTDSSAPGMTRASMILDAGTGRTVMLWHDTKTATEHDFYQALRLPARASVPATPPSITPTSRVPFASEMTVSVGGNAPNAERWTFLSHTTEVTSISTEPIPDSIFEIPAGYTVTTR